MDVIDHPTVTLELSRRFDASPERVFDAWVGKDWGAWFGPAGCRCEIMHMDVRAGGTYRLRMTMADGREVETSGTYHEIDPPRRLVFTFAGCFHPGEMQLTVTFRPDGDGTLMTLHQEGFHEEAQRQGFHTGWTGQDGSFDKLERYLSR